MAAPCPGSVVRLLAHTAQARGLCPRLTGVMLLQVRIALHVSHHLKESQERKEGQQMKCLQGKQNNMQRQDENRCFRSTLQCRQKFKSAEDIRTKCFVLIEVQPWRAQPQEMGSLPALCLYYQPDEALPRCATPFNKDPHSRIQLKPELSPRHPWEIFLALACTQRTAMSSLRWKKTANARYSGGRRESPTRYLAEQ
ncbi:uncharacterized protein LOC142407117 isoform X2 [Mycteria americana]